jgi:hypothetical protein
MDAAWLSSELVFGAEGERRTADGVLRKEAP